MHLSGVILPNKNGEILLIHRATPRRTQWEIPGGKIEPNEEPPVAAAREALEELGVEVSIIRELGSESFEEDGHSIMYTWFLGDTNSAKPRIGEPD
jgi:8-oxo-dGTP pyrophosphatase MutT (NUDIX family)